MRQVILVLLAIYVSTDYVVNGFILDSINMTNETFDEVSLRDGGSDAAGSRVVAEALREYMTQNHIKILLEQSNYRENL